MFDNKRLQITFFKEVKTWFQAWATSKRLLSADMLEIWIYTHWQKMFEFLQQYQSLNPSLQLYHLLSCRLTVNLADFRICQNSLESVRLSGGLWNHKNDIQMHCCAIDIVSEDNLTSLSFGKCLDDVLWTFYMVESDLFPIHHVDPVTQAQLNRMPINYIVVRESANKKSTALEGNLFFNFRRMTMAEFEALHKEETKEVIAQTNNPDDSENKTRMQWIAEDEQTNEKRD